MAPHSSTLVWKIPWTEEPGRLQSMGSLRVHTTERLHFHFSLSCIGEGNGNHSSVLAWRIPGTVEPGGLPSMGLHRVGHDWSDLAAAAARSWFESSFFIRCFFFLISLPHSSTIVLYTSEINNLYLEPCLGVCFWRIQAKSQLYVLLFITFPRISRLTPWRPCFRNSKVLYIKGIVLELKMALQDQ